MSPSQAGSGAVRPSDGSGARAAASASPGPCPPGVQGRPPNSASRRRAPERRAAGGGGAAGTGTRGAGGGRIPAGPRGRGARERRAGGEARVRAPRGREGPGRRAGGALGGAHRGDARLPSVRRARPGPRGGEECSCRQLRGAVAVPLPAAAAPPPVPESGQGRREQEGRSAAPVVVTGDAEGGAVRLEGARVRERGRGAEAGAPTVARKGRKGSQRQAGRTAQAPTPRGWRGRFSEQAPALTHVDLANSRWLLPACVTGRD